MKLEPITSLILVYFPECVRALRMEILKRSGHRSSSRPDDDKPWLMHRRGRNFLEEVQAEWFDVGHHVAYDSYEPAQEASPHAFPTLNLPVPHRST